MCQAEKGLISADACLQVMGDQWLSGGDSALVRVCQTDPWGTTAALLPLIVPP